MNTHNLTNTHPAMDLLSNPAGPNQNAKLEVVYTKTRNTILVHRKTSVLPQKVKPSHSMTSMRSLKPSKIVIG